eukprot:4596794-Pyramimonas_sp.AAC.1
MATYRSIQCESYAQGNKGMQMCSIKSSCDTVSETSSTSNMTRAQHVLKYMKATGMANKPPKCASRESA